MPETHLTRILNRLEEGKGRQDALTVIYFTKNLQMKKYNPMHELSEYIVGKKLAKKIPKETVIRRYRAIVGKLKDYSVDPLSSDSCILEFEIMAILEEGDNPKQIFARAEKGNLSDYWHRVIKNATYSRISINELKNVKILPI